MQFPQSNDYNAGNSKLKYGLNVVAPADSDSDEEESGDNAQQEQQNNSRASNVLFDESDASNSSTSSLNTAMAPPPPSLKKTQVVAVDKYEVPFWSPETSVYPWQLEVIKEGIELAPVSLVNKGYYVVGRLPTNDIAMAHPSLSREHAVFQHRKNGDMYIYDLDSTHGTFVNKVRIKPRVYTALKNGDFLRFGASTRMYIVGGGPTPVTAQKPKPARRETSVASEPVPSTHTSSIDDDGNQQLFTGNAADFKEYLEQQKKKAKKKNKLTAKMAGFDLNADREPSQRQKDKLDFEERRTFVSRSKRHLVEEESDDEPEFSSDEDDELTQRKHLGYEHDLNERFDDDDDFYDRTDKKRKKKGKKNDKNKKQKREEPLTYTQLASRRDGLLIEANRVKDEIVWFEVNVLDAALTKATQASDDSLAQFEQQAAIEQRRALLKQMQQLLSEIQAAQSFAEKLSKVAAPAHADAQREVDTRVRRECLWLKDSVVREFIGRVDDTFLPIKRRRPRRPVPESVARKADIAVEARAISAEQIAAEERQFETPTTTTTATTTTAAAATPSSSSSSPTAVKPPVSAKLAAIVAKKAAESGTPLPVPAASTSTGSALPVSSAKTVVVDSLTEDADIKPGLNVFKKKPAAVVDTPSDAAAMPPPPPPTLSSSSLSTSPASNATNRLKTLQRKVGLASNDDDNATLPSSSDAAQAAVLKVKQALQAPKQRGPSVARPPPPPRSTPMPQQHNYDGFDEDAYDGWVPPSNQTGDGMTELNKKLGY